MKDKKMIMLRLVAVLLVFAMLLPLTSEPGVWIECKANRIALNKTKVSIKRGITSKIEVKNKPSGAKVSWSSKNKKIARVKKGVITGMKKGNTVVICKIAYKKGKENITKKLKTVVKVKKQ